MILFIKFQNPSHLVPFYVIFLDLTTKEAHFENLFWKELKN